MAEPVIMPKFEMAQESGTITRWIKLEGDIVKKGEPIAEIEADKATMEIEAPASGILRGISAEPGKIVPVAQVIAYILEPGETWSTETSCAEMPSTRAVHATPVARRVAADLGVDTQVLAGSGIGGRVTRADVEAFVRIRATPAARRMARERNVELGNLTGTGPQGRIQARDVAASAGTDLGQLTTATSNDTSETIVPLSSVRAVIAQRMAASARSVPRVTLTTRIDASEFVRLREHLKAGRNGHVNEPSFGDLLVALVARALTEHPRLNARLLDDGLHMVRSVNIGIAVDTERGLVVPVIRNASEKRLADISRESRALIERARSGRNTLDDLSGGTFTITNMGAFDIDVFTPIINTPEVAILGVGRITTEPCWDGQQFIPRPQLALSLSIDHRAVDGAPGARFLQRLAQLIQEPFLLLS